MPYLRRDERGWRIPLGKISTIIYEGLLADKDPTVILQRIQTTYPEKKTSIQTVRCMIIKIQGAKERRTPRDERGWLVPRAGSIARVVYDGMVRDEGYNEIIANIVAAFPGRRVSANTVNASSWRIRDSAPYSGLHKKGEKIQPRPRSAVFTKLAEASRTWQEQNASAP
jgi:hypothetical protein